MNKRQIKAYSEAYDSLYNLNSLNYEFDDILKTLEDKVKLLGFEFKLNQKQQKFKLLVIK